MNTKLKNKTTWAQIHLQLQRHPPPFSIVATIKKKTTIETFPNLSSSNPTLDVDCVNQTGLLEPCLRDKGPAAIGGQGVCVINRSLRLHHHTGNHSVLIQSHCCSYKNERWLSSRRGVAKPNSKLSFGSWSWNSLFEPKKITLVPCFTFFPRALAFANIIRISKYSNELERASTLPGMKKANRRQWAKKFLFFKDHSKRVEKVICHRHLTICTAELFFPATFQLFSKSLAWHSSPSDPKNNFACLPNLTNLN